MRCKILFFKFIQHVFVLLLFYCSSCNIAFTQDFGYDLTGRVTSQNLPGNRAIAFDYDAAGNITGITPPQKPEHSFSYTPVNLGASYEPPSVSGIGNPATTYKYNLDKQLTLATRPDGRAIAYNYGQTNGRLESITATTDNYVYVVYIWILEGHGIWGC